MIRLSVIRVALLVAGTLAAVALPAPARGAPGEDDRRGTSGGGSQERPDWSIEREVKQIERSMDSFVGLSEQLSQASQELSQDFEAYLADPKNEVLASSIQRKMALFADQVVRDFDRVIADQDSLLTSFKELRRKLGRYDHAFADKIVEYEGRVEGFRFEADEHEQKLIRLAVEIKEARRGDPEAAKALEGEFAQHLRRFRLKNRNIRGMEMNLQNYKVLQKNLTALHGLFAQLQSKFTDLVENLEHEKGYLLAAIEYQQDAARIQKIMDEGFYYGERSIKNVTEKLAQIYLRVDAFTAVHDRIGQGLGRFAETTDTLSKLSSVIEEVGQTGVGEPGTPALDEAIEFFSKQRPKLKDDR